MTTTMRPSSAEYIPYYGRYIDLVPDGDIVDLLEDQMGSTMNLLGSVSEEKADYRYAEGKWSLKEVVGHVIDAERVFAFRAFVFSRRDAQPFPGMEQDDYARAANYGERSLRDILEEFRAVRVSTIQLFKSFSDELMLRKGTASGCEFSVRSTMYIVAGHERHHVRVLKERYLL